MDPLTEAREHAAAGRLDLALDHYKTALARSPKDWTVIGEIAEFVGLQLKDFTAGMELARAAVELNPWYSAWLWNILGDCLFSLERFEHAHEAYLQAQRINPLDPRTNLDLAYTHLQLGTYQKALQAIAVGLSNDKTGAYYSRLLEKQQHVLSALSNKWIGEQDRLALRTKRLLS